MACGSSRTITRSRALPARFVGCIFKRHPTHRDKLVRVIKGSVTDVAVDIRKGSPTFGKWVSVMLSADNAKQLLVPKGFPARVCHPGTRHRSFIQMHRFLRALNATAAFKFDDPDLAIDWGMDTSTAVLIRQG